MHFILRHPVFSGLIVCIAVLGYLVFDKVQQQTTPDLQVGSASNSPLVQVETVSWEEMSNQVESVGTAIANESINLTANVSEKVSAVHFQDGDFVQQGDVLVELTNGEQTTRLAETQASVNDARRQYNRLESLAHSNLVSSTDLDAARTALETAEARLEGVLVTLEDRVVRAPFTGLLGFRNVSAGSLISPGTTITTLDDISTIKLDFTIPEIYLADLKTGQNIQARSVVYPDRKFEGVVETVGSRIDPATRSVVVRARLDNPDTILRPGMLLTVDMNLNQRQSITVPEEAVIVNQGRMYVYVIDEENRARQVDVTLGQRRPGIVEVLSGLYPDQRVVTQGLAQVQPGQVVRIHAPDRQPDSLAGKDS